MDELRRMMHMLYIVSGLVVIRSLFRAMGYDTGAEGYPMTHEWPFFVSDTILMLGVLTLFCFYCPSRIPGLIRGKQSIIRII